MSDPLLLSVTVFEYWACMDGFARIRVWRLSGWALLFSVAFAGAYLLREVVLISSYCGRSCHASRLLQRSPSLYRGPLPCLGAVF